MHLKYLIREMSHIEAVPTPGKVVWAYNAHCPMTQFFYNLFPFKAFTKGTNFLVDVLYLFSIGSDLTFSEYSNQVK